MSDPNIQEIRLDTDDLDLDLTSARWRLKEGQASIVQGLDVTRRGVIKPDGGRRRVDIAIPEDLGTVTGAAAIDLSTIIVTTERRMLVTGDAYFTSTSPGIARSYDGYVNFLYGDANTYWDASEGYIVYAGAPLSGEGSIFKVNVPRIGDVVHVTSPEAYRGVYRVGARDVDPADPTNFLKLLDPIADEDVWNLRFRWYSDPGYEQYCAYYPVDDDGEEIPGYVRAQSGDDNDETRAIIKNPLLYDLEGPWESKHVGATVVFAPDDSQAVTTNYDNGYDGVTRVVAGLATYANRNDTIYFRTDLDQNNERTHPALYHHRESLSNGPPKFEIRYAESKQKRGIWVTNGRKFWLICNGAYVEYLDLGSNDHLGTEWRFEAISRRSILVTAPNQASRILRIEDPQVSEQQSSPIDAIYGETSNLAGIFPPAKPDEIEDAEQGENTNPSWFFDLVGDGGDISSGTPRIKIRAVNLDDGAESKLVDVWFTVGSQAITLEGNYQEGAGYSVGDICGKPVVNSSQVDGDTGGYYASAPVHQRWTHIEIFRKQNGTDDYYREKRIVICPVDKNRIHCGSVGWGDIFQDRSKYVFFKLYQHGDKLLGLSDTDLGALTQLSDEDLDAGGVPPICQRALYLQGVTLCFGSASVENPTVPAKTLSMCSPWAQVSATTVQASNLSELVYFDDGKSWLYVWDKGRPAAFNESGIVSPYEVGRLYPLEQYSYNGVDRVSLETEVSLDASNKWQKVGGLLAHRVDIPVPIHENDELVYYSRTDKFAPESFPDRTLELSQVGDTFQRAVVVRNKYAVVIMSGAVHLLYFSGTTLTKQTVSQAGRGTAWPESVIVVDNLVVWANGEGLQGIKTYDEENQDGNRAEFFELDPERKLVSWFRDAADNNQRVDAGYDELNRCIRFRRQIDDNTFQCLQFGMRSQKWTIIDDDNGKFYVKSRFAESGDPKPYPLMYSLTKEGALFEVNYRKTSSVIPYDGLTVQGVIGPVYALKGRRRIARINKSTFSSLMIGEVVRFVSDNENVNGVARVIRSAGDRFIEFDTVPELKAGDQFIIGATRFKIRFSAIKRQIGSGIVNCDGVTAIIRRGAYWEDYASEMGQILIKAYRNYSDIPEAQDSEGNTFLSVDIFDDTDEKGKAYISDDRYAGVQLDGRAIEIEIENNTARTDFAVELITVDVRVEEDRVEDEQFELEDLQIDDPEDLKLTPKERRLVEKKGKLPPGFDRNYVLDDEDQAVGPIPKPFGGGDVQLP